MTQLPRDVDLVLWTAAGVVIPPGTDLLNVADATTYYAEVGGAEAGLSGVQWSWGATLVASITYESTNYPPSQAVIFVAAGALWYPEAGVPALVIPGGSSSTQMQHFADFGARRMRAKIVVTTGGTAQLRGRPHFKVCA